MSRRYSWASLPDRELLKLRIKDLKLSLKGTWLEDCVADLHEELERRDIRVRPHAWLSDEWFSSEATPGIAIPFYLAHPRLIRLERKKILDVEGGTRAECMRILRHETGHVLQHAYNLQRRRRWQQLFGRSSTPYPEFYRPNPASKSHVQHLRLWYGQSHPDEDFAETFAVWMGPRANWRKRYEGWPALEKLEYVDALMAEIGMAKPELTGRSVVEPVSRNEYDTRRLLQGEAEALHHRPADGLRSRPEADLLRRSAAPPRTACHHVPAPPRRPYPRHRRKVDRAVPVEHRCRAGRHDDPLPRSQPAGGRTGTAIGDRLHRATHLQDRAIPLHPYEAAMVRAVKKAKRPLKVLVLLHPELVPPEFDSRAIPRRRSTSGRPSTTW